jgi:hypothetical protein
MQGYVWDCSEDQEPKPFTFSQGSSLHAVAQSALTFSPRLVPGPASAVCVNPNVVLVGMPALKRGRVIFVGAPGAAVGDDPARLFSLTPATLPQTQCTLSFRAFLERLGFGKRLSSLPRCSAVDAVFAIRIEQFSSSQPPPAESDDESYEDESLSESSESSQDDSDSASEQEA